MEEVLGDGFPNATDEAIRAALGTLCGVEDREALAGGLEEAVVMKGPSCRE
jgi:hypothetical protein